MKTVITAASLYTPVLSIDLPVVSIEDGCILSIGSRAQTEVPSGAQVFDFPGCILSPGFIDLHIHGGAGYDVMEDNDAALTAVGLSIARHGVTGYLPTTVTASEDKTLRALERLGAAVARRDETDSCARPLGIHLEGPFISHAKRGVHPPQDLIAPSAKMLDRFWNASGGSLRMMTIAPELPGAIETILRATELGIHASLGHSAATYGEARAGIDAGADHATHTFNAMRPLDHRDPGILGAILGDRTLTADIIVDGIHVDPAVVRIFLAAKGEDRSILITDAISATGMPDGQFSLGALTVEVRDGRCEHEGKLAGSVLTLDRAVRNVMDFAGWKLQQAIRLASLNPATLLGSSCSVGVLAAGRPADLIALTSEGRIVQTFIAGKPVL